MKKLPDGFDEKYQYFFKKGFVNPNGIFNEFYYSIAEALLTKYFFDSDDLRMYFKNPYNFEHNKEITRLNKIMRNYGDSEPFLYNYLKKETVICGKYGVNEGQLAFSHPENFDDPFDCNCVLSNDVSMMDRFRVLCMTPIYNNILMWSHYSEDHKGYCFGYSFFDIINSILSLEYEGLCVIGFVSYKDDPPNFEQVGKYFSYIDLKSYIDATFTKFIDWKYEQEFRFVIIIDDNSLDRLKKDRDYVTIKNDIRLKYKGINSHLYCGYEKNHKGGLDKINKNREEIDKYEKI